MHATAAHSTNSLAPQSLVSSADPTRARSTRTTPLPPPCEASDPRRRESSTMAVELSTLPGLRRCCGPAGFEAPPTPRKQILLSRTTAPLVRGLKGTCSPRPAAVDLSLLPFFPHTYNSSHLTILFPLHTHKPNQPIKMKAAFVLAATAGLVAAQQLPDLSKFPQCAVRSCSHHPGRPIEPVPTPLDSARQHAQQSKLTSQPAHLPDPCRHRYRLPGHRHPVRLRQV